MCDVPFHGYATLNVSEEGNYQCRNTPYNLNLQQFQVQYMVGQIEDHDLHYGELSIFNATDCKGDNQTVLGLPYCTTVPSGWGRILSYRVWLEGGCGPNTISPCPDGNGVNTGFNTGSFKDHKRTAGPSTTKPVGIRRLGWLTGSLTTQTHPASLTPGGHSYTFIGTQTRPAPNSTGLAARDPEPGASSLRHGPGRLARAGPLSSVTENPTSTFQDTATTHTFIRASDMHTPSSTSTGVYPRSKITTKKTVPAASVGVEATVSF